MLTETLVLSTLSTSKISTASRDLGIHLHSYQPLPSPQNSFKKSSTAPNSLAANSSHIFAAQAEKAVVHVYNREHGNQEAVVPFPEKIRSIALAGDFEESSGTLVLGTQEGKILAWELATGRLITTPSSHLQPTTSLAVSPNNLHILSGSADAQIHLWSLPSLLSFSASNEAAPLTPELTLSSHRGPITALAFGHTHMKTNIAVSASNDNTIIVWDYLSGQSLHTFLVPSPAQCLTLDPADRAIYAGYADGSIQSVEIFSPSSLSQKIWDPNAQATPTQTREEDRWKPPVDVEGHEVLCMDTSYDGTMLISGHENGKIYTWDVAKGKFSSALYDYTLPITNLIMLPPMGWPYPKIPRITLRHVVKPRYESTFSADLGGGSQGGVPLQYTFTAAFPSSLPLSHRSDASDSAFQEALTHPYFPSSLLEEGLTAFDSLPSAAAGRRQLVDSSFHDMANETQEVPETQKMEEENVFLKEQLKEALARGREAVKENLRHDRERWKRQEEARFKAERKKRRRLRRLKIEENARKKVMGEPVDSDVDMSEGTKEAVEDQDLSSDTDEITDSDD